ncbi:MAG: thioesterase family protein [Bacteroidota bacterium]
MFSHRFQKRVRYAETDKMGYLYYGHYAKYYEIGRVEMLRALGFSYQIMEDEYKIMMPVVSLQSRFVRPAYYDDLLTIETTLRKLPDQFITFHVEIFNLTNKLVNGGNVKLCFVDMNTNKSVNTPRFLLDKLEVHFRI